MLSSAPTPNLTPMMQQYLEAKQQSPGAILLFRMGDFYELFHDDARQAAQILGLALTSREKGENAIPMAGFPHPALESYLGKLIAAGQRVAIAEQVENPKFAKGLVKREIIRIVTPGTLTDDALLDPRESNYLAAISTGEPLGLAWVELSTGRFLAMDVPAAALADELARINPVEILVSDGGPQLILPSGSQTLVTRRSSLTFERKSAAAALKTHFGVSSLAGFGFDGEPAALSAAGAILDYLRETQKANLAHLDQLLPYSGDATLKIDESTRRSLELFRTIRDQRRDGALLGVLDQTHTAMGARLLAEWLANPLARKEPIEARLDAVGEFVGRSDIAAAVGEQLGRIYDLERLLSRITTGRASPRDLGHLGETLRQLPEIKRLLSHCQCLRLKACEQELDLIPDLQAELTAALEQECPQHARDGGFIRSGYHAELDRLRDLASGGKQWIANYQAREIERTGIANLKVGFNKVFGYYIEITQSQLAKAPGDYQRRQTVKNAERYITPELKQYEEQVLTAEERTIELEQEIFLVLRERVSEAARRFQATARVLAELDVYLSLATVARQRGYCRPKIVAEPALEIIDGRHPVLDQMLPEGTFVPNDARLGGEHGQVLLITGPNMAGKSTYIRQTALLVLMAQMGSFIPARHAIIGLADRIFARVGASDELSRGQSTFMVEMTETARILHTATPASLVILDEIGRGTSTYDGVSLAWSVVEHIHNAVGSRTLFATHYHELTQLSDELPGVRNWTVAVREWQDEVVFLHKIIPGAADKSYGLHVARLAGVPKPVIERASQILAHLESQHVPAAVRFQQVKRRVKPIAYAGQRMLFMVEEVERDRAEK